MSHKKKAAVYLCVAILLCGAVVAVLMFRQDKTGYDMAGEPCPYCGTGRLVTSKELAVALWQGKERVCEHGMKGTKDYYMQIVEYITTQCTTADCYAGNGQETSISYEWFCGTKEKEGRVS